MSEQCDITPEQLSRAIRIYWRHAWPEGSGVCPALPDWSDLTTREVLQHFVDESDKATRACKRYVLRLGNHLYPHMKFAIEQCVCGGDFYFLSDCHDDALAPRTSDIAEWNALRTRNYAIKLAIEAEWQTAGLPTFLTASTLARGSFQRPEKTGKRVLVIDDEPANVELTSAMLRAQGFGIESAHSGTDALQRANRQKPDLIVTDYEMPGMTGREVAEKIRANEDTREIPILICTYADVSEADLRPADALLRRPFSQEELTSTVTKLLEGRN
jgi:CheY-like chemotaxis protein